MTRAMVAPLAIGALGVAVLVALGAWQMQRLEWKRGVIATIENRLAAPPGDLPADPAEAADEYRRVRLDGRLLPGELHVYTSAPPRGVGYRVIAPFETDGGRRVLVDRGFVPIGDKDAARPPGPLSLHGVLLWPDETDRFTSPPDREANIWYARDVAPMAEALGTEPVMVVVTASSAPQGTEPLPVTASVRNDHLQYAVTWFGLAAAWTVMTAYWLWRIKRRTA